MRGRGDIRSNAAVSPVGSAAELGSLIGLNVVNNQRVKIETSDFSVRLSVLEEIQKIASALLRPSALSGSVSLGLGSAADAVNESAEGNAILVVNDIVEISLGALQAHSLDGLAGLTSILEVNTEIGATSLNRPRTNKHRRKGAENGQTQSDWRDGKRTAEEDREYRRIVINSN